MTYEQVKSLKSEDFTAMFGVRPDTNNCDGRGSAIALYKQNRKQDGRVN